MTPPSLSAPRLGRGRPPSPVAQHRVRRHGGGSAAAWGRAPRFRHAPPPPGSLSAGGEDHPLVSEPWTVWGGPGCRALPITSDHDAHASGLAGSGSFASLSASLALLLWKKEEGDNPSPVTSSYRRLQSANVLTGVGGRRGNGPRPPLNVLASPLPPAPPDLISGVQTSRARHACSLGSMGN